MSEFTQGKWRVLYFPEIVGIVDEDNDPIQLNEANARLIAAAPEMYRLLEECANELGAIGLPTLSRECYELLARIDGQEKGGKAVMTEYYPNRQKKVETLPNGTYRELYEDGQILYEELPDGTYRSWYKNGQMSNEELPDGTYHEWNEYGELLYEELPDGKETDNE
ncbi:MAG: hypothetical protein IJ587_10985 [Synergistaceae bacterium]|nr:hypothetical protein [Synergistaceae bacterium]